MARAPTFVVAGAIANKHLSGGEAWVRLNWVLGLRRLGCEVYFVEQIQSAACVDETGAPASFEQSANLRYFKDILRLFGMEQRACLVCDDGRYVYGLSYTDLLEAAAGAVLINISGHLTLDSIFDRVRQTAYIDEDPGFTQFWRAQGISGLNLERHDLHYTAGENIGAPECLVPACGIGWRAQRRFVVLAQWPRCTEGADQNRLTTVGAWRGPFGPVEHNGKRFGLKLHEFRKFVTLPRHAPQTFEIALSIHPSDAADLERLHAEGWRIANPREVAGDPLAYRRYVQTSGGEFSAAQGMYVETQCGWISDRTVQYLASGKPALVQDTGFGRNVPVGEGLVAFRTLDDAIVGAADIAANYDRHARAARALAESFFDSDIVLRAWLAGIGIAVPSRGTHHG